MRKRESEVLVFLASNTHSTAHSRLNIFSQKWKLGLLCLSSMNLFIMFNREKLTFLPFRQLEYNPLFCLITIRDSWSALLWFSLLEIKIYHWNSNITKTDTITKEFNALKIVLQLNVHLLKAKGLIWCCSWVLELPSAVKLNPTKKCC